MSANITKELVAHVAKLGMIKIDDSAMSEYQNHLTKILKHVEDLDKVNTDGVLPFANPMRERLELFANHDDRRNDTPSDSLPVSEVLKNAPDQKLNQFKIEAVIEGE
jgi:aspartyl-tRNA(Asn)/glutamyl-tRNA(Gln) amidotransferase subunit C